VQDSLPKITDNAVYYIENSLPFLETVSFAFNEQLTDEALDALAERAPKKINVTKPKRLKVSEDS
jgi:hypothetical protein